MLDLMLSYVRYVRASYTGQWHWTILVNWLLIGLQIFSSFLSSLMMNICFYI